MCVCVCVCVCLFVWVCVCMDKRMYVCLYVFRSHIHTFFNRSYLPPSFPSSLHTSQTLDMKVRSLESIAESEKRAFAQIRKMREAASAQTSMLESELRACKDVCASLTNQIRDKDKYASLHHDSCCPCVFTLNCVCLLSLVFTLNRVCLLSIQYPWAQCHHVSLRFKCFKSFISFLFY